MDEDLSLLALKIKNKNNSMLQNECDKIRTELINSLKYLGTWTKIVGNEYKSNIMTPKTDVIKISGDNNFNNNEIKKSCNIDIVDIQQQIQNISNLKININLIGANPKLSSNYAELNFYQFYWKIKVDK